MLLTQDQILEIGKLFSDIFKTMITLNTGMVVILITIIEKVFDRESILKPLFNKIFLIGCLLLLMFSLVFSIYGLVDIPNRSVNLIQLSECSQLSEQQNTQQIKQQCSNLIAQQSPEQNTWVNSDLFYGSTILFFIGVLFLVIFAIGNFLFPSRESEPIDKTMGSN
jgi:hypothetical protein